MVKIDIKEKEAQAIVKIIDAWTGMGAGSAEMGYILTTIKYKLFEAFKKDGVKKNKEAAKKLLSDEYEFDKEKEKHTPKKKK